MGTLHAHVTGTCFLSCCLSIATVLCFEFLFASLIYAARRALPTGAPVQRWRKRKMSAPTGRRPANAHMFSLTLCKQKWEDWKIVGLCSARRQFAMDCEASGLPPLPLLINRDDSDSVNLNNYRLGDALAIAYSDGLRHLQKQGICIRELHLASCHLGAPSTVAMTQAVAQFSELVFLDLTENRIGAPGAAALQEALGRHRSIQEVILAKNQLGDRTAGQHQPAHACIFRSRRRSLTVTLAKTTGKLLASLVGHPSLTSLDLSSNDIGQSALLHVPLATMLKVEGQLTHLKLGWNRLNVHAMTAIVEPLRYNPLNPSAALHCALPPPFCTGGCWSFNRFAQKKYGGLYRANTKLTHLDMSWNALEDKGGMKLGKATD